MIFLKNYIIKKLNNQKMISIKKIKIFRNLINNYNRHNQNLINKINKSRYLNCKYKTIKIILNNYKLNYLKIHKLYHNYKTFNLKIIF